MCGVFCLAVMGLLKCYPWVHSNVYGWELHGCEVHVGHPSGPVPQGPVTQTQHIGEGIALDGILGSCGGDSGPVGGVDNVTGVASNLIMRGRAVNLLGTKNNIEAKEECEEFLYNMMGIN